MEDDNQLNTLDVLQGIMETDRAFYQALRFLNSNREQLLATHQRNTAAAMSLIRLHALRGTRTVQYTATIPLNFPVGWDEAVPVRATAAQIAAGSAVVTVDDAEPTNCSICQETLSSTHTRLTHCGHRFHTSCIAEWFTQSVSCPMCRHDIRETGSPAPTSSAPVSGLLPASSRLAAWLVGANPTNHTVETAESDEHHA